MGAAVTAGHVFTQRSLSRHSATSATPQKTDCLCNAVGDKTDKSLEATRCTCARGLGSHLLTHEREQVFDCQGMGTLALDLGNGAIQALQLHQPSGCVI